MRAIACTVAVLAALAIQAAARTRIDAISTTFRWFGPNDKIIVERYDDPKVANVSCYMSRADTGGLKGGLGLAEDPSRFSIACRAVGPIAMPPGLPKSEVIAFASASLFSKTFQIHRAVDAEKNVLVYTVLSTKLIKGCRSTASELCQCTIRYKRPSGHRSEPINKIRTVGTTYCFCYWSEVDMHTLA